jgi:hypothetical protein
MVGCAWRIAEKGGSNRNLATGKKTCNLLGEGYLDDLKKWKAF